MANPVIQHWKLGSIEPSFPEEVESSGQVETIAIRNLSDDELLALSKDLALRSTSPKCKPSAPTAKKKTAT